MLLIKWIFFIFIQLTAGKSNYFSIADISSVTNLNTNEQNFTIPNTIVAYNDKNSAENNENEYQSVRKPVGHTKTVFLNSPPLRNNGKPTRIKIHCCKKNNSVIECKYGTYKCIMKLNNNSLNQDQVNGLVRSIYMFIDTLTNTNYATGSMISTPVSFSYLDDSNRVNKYTGDYNKLDSNKFYPSIDDESGNSKNKFKIDDDHKQNRIIECTLDGGENSIDHIQRKESEKNESSLKLTCKLVGTGLLEPDFFIIPFSKSKSKKLFRIDNANKFYLNTTEVYDELYNSHELKKRNCKTRYKPIIRKIEIFDNNENDENILTERETKRDKVKNKHFQGVNNNNFNMNIDFTDSNSGTMKPKLHGVKAWMTNLQAKSLKMKKQDDEDDSETQSQFLFHTKHSYNIEAKTGDRTIWTEMSEINDTTTKKGISKNIEMINTKINKQTDESDDVSKKEGYDNEKDEKETTTQITIKLKNLQENPKRTNFLLSGISTVKPNYSSTGKSNKWSKKQSTSNKTSKYEFHKPNNTSVSPSIGFFLDDFNNDITTYIITYDEDDDDDIEDFNDTMNKSNSNFKFHTTSSDRNYKYNNYPFKYMSTYDIDELTEAEQADEQSKLNSWSSPPSFLKKMFNINNHNSKNGTKRNEYNRKTTPQLNQNEENLVKYVVNDETTDNFPNEVMETIKENNDDKNKHVMQYKSEDNQQNNKTINNSFEINNRHLSDKIKMKEEYNKCLQIFKEEENHRKSLFDYITNLKMKRLHELKQRNLWRKNILLYPHKNFNVRLDKGKRFVKNRNLIRRYQ